MDPHGRSMSRRGFLGVCAAMAAAPAAPQTRRKPNIVWMLADDLGYGDPRCFGNKAIQTPSLDRMAAEGVRLSSFYVSAPVCSPTRAALLTGRCPQRNGLTNVIETTDRTTHLAPSEVLLPQVLAEAGYACGLIGKWHLGEQPPYRPNRRGFGFFFGGVLGGLDFFNHTFENRQHDLWRNGQRIHQDGEYITDLCAAEAEAFIARHKDRPFLLFVAFHAPHVAMKHPREMQAPERWLRRYAPDGALTRRVRYQATVSAMDEAVGRVMAALASNGLDEHTLVVFLSDNGPEPRAGGTAKPLRGTKHTLWEGGIRVPAIARWPGRIPKGARHKSCAMDVDLFPTALAAAGVEKPNGLVLDGRDILPILTNDAAGEPRDLYWSYIRDTLRISREKAVRRGRWKWLNGELYDLEADIGERRNVATTHPDVARALAGAWAEWASQFPGEVRRWGKRGPKR